MLMKKYLQLMIFWMILKYKEEIINKIHNNYKTDLNEQQLLIKYSNIKGSSWHRKVWYFRQYDYTCLIRKYLK